MGIVARREESLPKLNEDIIKWKENLIENTSPEIFNNIVKDIRTKVDKIENMVIETKKRKYLRDVNDYKTGNVRKQNKNGKTRERSPHRNRNDRVRRYSGYDKHTPQHKKMGDYRERSLPKYKNTHWEPNTQGQRRNIYREPNTQGLRKYTYNDDKRSYSSVVKNGISRKPTINGEKTTENRRNKDSGTTLTVGKYAQPRPDSTPAEIASSSSSFFRKDPINNRLQWPQKTLPQESPGKRQRIIEEEEEEEELHYREKRNRKRM
ncbi:Hypothetical predicted protein [Pelobates cultripes]|uniref:Uncharacterized protein n=1 Tax=Pelobates cultripes TaxID=61616 RepID=A0AAD1SIU4_PELCU|nr:Hypothetical predicted protein [Pelobates cultripes]